MRWEGLNEFVAVAESQSFTAASRLLKVSIAQVSRQISRLEDRLKLKLFYRTTRRVSLTESGAVYYQYCRRILDDLNEAELAVTSLHETPRGLLKLTAPVTYGEEKIAPLINDFLCRYPELDIQLELSNRIVDLVDEGFDMAIRLGSLNDSGFIAQQLALRSWHVCAAPEYLQASGLPKTLNDLKEHNCLTGTSSTWRFRQASKEKRVHIKGSLVCNSGYSLVDAALKGLGLIQLPDYYVKPYIESGKLLTVLDNYQASDEGIWAVYPDKHHLSLKLKLLINFLTAAV